VTFLKRVFSSDYRRGLAAEASGDYAAAARAYALAGERAKVAEMHLLAAERAGGAEARLAQLRTGIRWADEEDEAGRTVRRRLARALLDHVRQTGVLSDSDRSLLHEAAVLFAGAGDYAGAGECHELAGDELLAAEAYQRAGEVERLEAVLGREESRRLRDGRQRDAYAEYQLHLASGARDRARAALAGAIGAVTGPDDRNLRGLLEALDARMLVDARVTLRAGGATTTYLGAFPIAVGRDPGCRLALRDPGISRRHAEIHELGGRFRLRDAGSRNGTRLGGLRLEEGGELPLDGEGDLGLGDHCGLRFRAEPGVLRIEIVRGMDRGRVIVASSGPVEIAGGAAELRFPDGRPTLAALGGRRLSLNGVHAGAPVQLLRDDRVVIEGGGDGQARVVIEVT